MRQCVECENCVKKVDFLEYQRIIVYEETV